MACCTTCFTDFIAKCNLELQVYAQLAPLSDYKWIITDKFSNKYEGQFTTDSNGFWTIPVDELPPGLLTQYSGLFTLEVQDTGCKPVKFKIAQEYDCIDFVVKGGTLEKNTLGCNFSCTPVAGSQTSLIPFTNQSEITVPWTSGLLAAFGNSPVVQVFHLVSGDTYQLVDVSIQETFSDGVLTSIVVNNAGPATGYILIS
jgi:hypothetical protein